MAICKYCGEDVPLEKLLPHINSKHREESRKKKQQAAANAQKPVVAPVTEESETPPVMTPVPSETPPPPPSGDEVELSESIPTEELPKAETTIVKTPGIFTYEITLPADAFTLFNLAKATGLEPNDGKLFDEWVWDCIRARFSKDYKQQLVLAPLEG